MAKMAKKMPINCNKGRRVTVGSHGKFQLKINYLNEGNANPDTGKHSGLVFHLLGQLWDAANGVKSVWGVQAQNHVQTTAGRVFLATAVGDVIALAECCVGPVGVVLDTTAVNLQGRKRLSNDSPKVDVNKILHSALSSSSLSLLRVR